MRQCFLVVTMALMVAACADGSSNPGGNDSEPDRTETSNATISVTWPDRLHAFGGGYPNAGNPCRRLGESAATADYLDDSADLVGCPTPEQAAALGGKIVATIDGFTLVSVPATRGESAEGPPAPSAKDLVRGKGGLEEKCLARVEEITHATVGGVNRIDESGRDIKIFVNVEGAEAPWLCIGRRDGTLGNVEYSGSEGDL